MIEDRDKILTQALFLMGKETFHPSACETETALRSLMIAILSVIHPKLKTWTAEDDHRIHFMDPSINGKVRVNGSMNPIRMFVQVRPFDPDWNKQFILSEIIPFIEKGVEEFRRQIASIDMDTGVVTNPNQSIAKIVPLLKSDAMIKGMDQSFIKQGLPDEDSFKLLHWPVVGRVRFVAAFDTPDNFQFMHRFDADELGITPDEARDHALSNFRATAMRIKMRTDYTKPVVSIDRIGGIASSLLLLPEFWEKEAIKARDELVIHATDYDTLLVARKSDKQALARLVGTALSGVVESIFSPPLIFVYDKDGLRLLERKDVA
jgi:uncharacterized protein YtpQ (UPF0354 family)